MSAEHVIPLITNPLGREWDQPQRDEILVDDSHALMTVATWAKLANYSCSIPTGVYEGKMWRREQSDGALLCWFGAGERPGFCSVNARRILLIDNSKPEAVR